ncbi:MAG: sigma 54-interacting transcriptional regulator [Gemmatimonadales bacterium]
MSIPGYDIQQEIYRGRRRVVFRATRRRDGLPAVIKTPADEFPAPAQLTALRREYQILSSLSIAGVARPLELVTHRDRVALVLEDAGGVPLKTLIASSPLPLRQVLSIGVQLATVLGELHRRGIIHKDVNPNNILVDAATSRVTLTDFGIASRLTSEPQPPSHPHLLEGTIAYMSPEQTGRMNRDVDYHTDLYSLGVTLYEMLTGRLPFDSSDPLELIHGHIARLPDSPALRRPELPEVVCRAVTRLLEKMPEARYQSAQGLRADLARFAAELEASGTVGEHPLGTEDSSTRFVVPQRLYGRAAEGAAVRAAFERVAAGATELVLVTGYSGIGKTSLIQEVYKSMTRGQAHLIAGKFDQLARDVPYRALAQAFQALVRQTLAASDEEVRTWAARLGAALGANAQVVIDVIPELERILGPQPPAPVLGPTEAQNRFNLVFQKFVAAFARADHPLVLFLDDLQWADAATLALLPFLLTDPDIRGLLVIGAYRDNEVSPTHPLRLTVGELAARVRIEEIALPPLDAGQLRELVADALRTDAGHASAAADLVLTKTGGNPFFVKQLLQSLHADGLITFDEATGGWRVDLDRTARVELADNVLALMAAKISRLGSRTQRALRLAACVGDRFDLRTLAIISQAEPAEAAADLWEAVEQGLVLSLDKSYGFAPDLSTGIEPAEIGYRFLHDRVQQAAYALIPEEGRRQAHLTVGRLLLERGGDARADSLFEVANHLNYGRSLIADAGERRRLAQLNLDAGRKAKASAAYPSALSHFTVGTELLPDTAWSEHYELAFALHLERAEAEYLCARLDEAERSFLALLERCRSPLDVADVYALLMVEYETMSRYADAIAAGLDGLRRLDVAVSADPAAWEPDLAAELDAIRRAIGTRPIASLVELPPVQDPGMRQAMRLLQAAWAPAYISGQTRLGDLVAARLVRLSLEHGVSEPSAFGFLHHAMTVGSVFGEYERGAEFGELALAVNERFADLRLRAIVHHRFAALVNAWRQPFANCIVHAREAVRAAFESGNLAVAGYAQFQQAWYGMQIERDLETFADRHGPTADLLARLQLHTYVEMQRVMLQWSEALRGRTETPISLSGSDFDEERYLKLLGGSGIFRALHATVKLELLHTFGQVEAARRYAATEEAAADVFVGSIWPAMFTFRHVLAICAWLPDAPAGERPPAETKLDRLEARLARWAESAPENFGHLHLLASAEIARVRQRPGDAVTLYDAALEAVAAQESPRHRALINELYGRFWLQRGQPKVAAVFLAEARFGYAQWGATAKVADLDRRYPELLRQGLAPDGSARPSGSSVLVSSETLDISIDAAAAIKAAQAIGQEIDLERLLDRLMRVALENAGAERGSLVLEGEAGPVVRVTGSHDRIEVLGGPTVPLAESVDLPVSLIHYVRRTRENVVVADAPVDERCAEDPYIVRERPRSVLCTAVLNQGTLVGTLYVENRLTPHAFTPERVRVMQLISAQAAIAIENARLYERTRQEVTERTRAEAKLRALAEGTAAVTAGDFFRPLVQHLADALQARYAFAAECTDAERTRVRTLAFWSGSDFAENVEYAVSGTPCQQVLGGDMCLHTRDIQALFPADTELQTLGAESYLGIPLRGATGDLLGHLAVLHTAPITPTPDDLAILRIFAARAGAELERKRTGDALRESQLRYSTMAETVPEVLFTAGTDGGCDYVSRRFSEYTGLPLARCLGQGWLAAVHTGDRERTTAAWEQSVRTGEAFETEYRLRRADGQHRWFRARAIPMRSPEEATTRWFGVATDIDDSKRAEESLRAALAEVRRLKDRLETENVYLQEQIETEHGFEEIVGRSPALRRVLTEVEQVAPGDTTVLITGETGTGKELLARAIHKLSPRRDRALITVNCGAISPGLVESELFGHEKGAFTGAVSRRIGRFEVADGGTLFLDEIGDLPLDSQVKLLRVLQEGEIERVGGLRPINVDVRVIAATHRDLEARVRDGRFRADLFYRLNVFPIRNPALRERAEDIAELVRYFVLKYAAKLGKRIEAVPRGVLEGLTAYPWPGNIRELANVIERSVILSRGSALELDGLLPSDSGAAPSSRGAGQPTLEEMERRHIAEVLEQTGWRVSGPRGAAVLLGLKPTTLEARMKKLGVRRPG